MPPTGSPPTWTVATSDVPSLVLSLNDLDRLHPVLVVSVASDTGKPRVVPEQLVSAVASTGAQVVVFTDMAAAQAFSVAAAGWNTYGGAVRLVAAPSAGDPGGLFLTFPNTAPELTIARIVRRLTHPATAPIVPVGAPQVPARAAPWIPTPAQLPRRPGATPSATPTHPATDPAGPVAPPTQQLVESGPAPVVSGPESSSGEDRDSAASRYSAVPGIPSAGRDGSGERRAADQDTACEELAAEQAAHARTLRELDELYEELQRRDDAVADYEDGLYRVPVFADPARQFRHELDLRLLHTVDEVTRDTNPPADYRLGRRWLDDLDDLAQTSKVRRTKVLDTAISVLLNRAHTIPGLNVHQLRTSAGGDSGFVRRDDGAIAWRASLQSHAPAARRLMWWSCPDGTVELARVARHDDLQIP